MGANERTGCRAGRHFSRSEAMKIFLPPKMESAMLIIYNGFGVHGKLFGVHGIVWQRLLMIEHGDVRYGYVSSTTIHIHTRSVWTVWTGKHAVCHCKVYVPHINEG